MDYMLTAAMSVRVKICGITNEADALAAVEVGADALGFVFASESPRRIQSEQAANIIRSLPASVIKVGLFVNAPVEHIFDVIAATGLDTVQLHGDESPEFCREIRTRVKVWKSFRVRSAETLATLPAYAEAADAWLLDAYVPGASGGTGQIFEWAHAVAAKKLGHPIILAGGLTPENVAKAVRQVQPFAVDVSSGVEQSPGKKDLAKVRRFVREAKGGSSQ